MLVSTLMYVGHWPDEGLHLLYCTNSNGFVLEHCIISALCGSSPIKGTFNSICSSKPAQKAALPDLGQPISSCTCHYTAVCTGKGTK